MSAEDRLLAATPILNFGHPSIEQLVAEKRVESSCDP